MTKVSDHCDMVAPQVVQLAVETHVGKHLGHCTSTKHYETVESVTEVSLADHSNITTGK